MMDSCLSLVMPFPPTKTKSLPTYTVCVPSSDYISKAQLRFANDMTPGSDCEGGSLTLIMWPVDL